MEVNTVVTLPLATNLHPQWDSVYWDLVTGPVPVHPTPELPAPRGAPHTG